MGDRAITTHWAVRPALIGGLLGLGGFVLVAASTTPASTAPDVPLAALAGPKPTALTHPFRNCAAARAAGAAPVFRGTPGYGPWLDGDDDGIGCEPYYGH